MELKAQRRYEFGPYVLDTGQHLLLRERKPIPLTPKTYDTLLVLVENSGRMLSKDELMKALWPESFVEESNLSVQISTIRKALGQAPGQDGYIVTVPGRGYRFAAEVKEWSSNGKAEAEDEDEVVIEDHSRSEMVIEEIEEDSRQDREEASDNWAAPATERPALFRAPHTATSPARSRRRTLLVVAGLVVLAAALSVALRPTLPAPRVLGYTQITHFGRVDPQNLFVTDGSRLFFVERSGGRWTLEETSVDGGAVVPIPTPFDRLRLLAISPDGSQLLMAEFADDDPSPRVWVMPTLGGAPRRLGNAIGEEGAWSPDGREIVYAHGSDLYETHGDGSAPHKLLSAPGLVQHPAWSPDGGTLRYTVHDPKSAVEQVWEAGADGANAHPWPPERKDWVSASYGDWTPDGRYFLFSVYGNGLDSIWARREKPGFFHRVNAQPVQLTSGPLNLNEPVISPDGKTFFALGGQNRGELAQYNVKSHEFDPYLAGASAHYVSFSRDGGWVAYVTWPDGTLWRSKPDGSSALQLTHAPLQALAAPAWSPDGTRLAFEGARPGQPARVYLISAQGGPLTQLLPGDDSEGNPAWSPDGRAVVVGPRVDQLVRPSSPTPLRTVDVGSRKASAIPGSAGLCWPSWSPDGRYIAAKDVSSHKLMLFDRKTQRWQLLASGALVHNPLWSRDSHYIYFQDLIAEQQPIMRARVADHKVERVADARGLHRADAIYNAFTGLSPDDSPLTFVIRGLYDIYALDLRLP